MTTTTATTTTERTFEIYETIVFISCCVLAETLVNSKSTQSIKQWGLEKKVGWEIKLLFVQDCGVFHDTRGNISLYCIEIFFYICQLPVSQGFLELE